jgi:hypothetical protein
MDLRNTHSASESLFEDSVVNQDYVASERDVPSKTNLRGVSSDLR